MISRGVAVLATEGGAWSTRGRADYAPLDEGDAIASPPSWAVWHFQRHAMVHKGLCVLGAAMIALRLARAPAI